MKKKGLETNTPAVVSTVQPQIAPADWIVRLMMHFIVVETSEKFMFGPMTSSSGEFL